MTDPANIIRISANQMKSEFFRILRKHGLTDNKAEKCAGIFMTNSLEGVYSHGVNRFHRFVSNIIDGLIKPAAEPTLINSSGALEQWNGNLGPGPLNALFATDRAMELGHEYGIGLVALADTNHWMRGGTYGWHAADKGFVFIGWTNTEANMPAWGAKDARLGNNPLVFAIPYGDKAIVLDFAMSLYSYGRMEAYKLGMKKLPFPGGYNIKGELTTDPGVILETRRTLPIGYWKGAGLSLVLDVLAAILTGGLSTHEITRRKAEYGLSQIFIAIILKSLRNYPGIEETISRIITDYSKSESADGKARIRYPGENILKIRSENERNGIPVNIGVWNKITAL
ncbi:MAG: 3-dehydro-L-gulonate 2-dehydrogenase [Bacteroidales bacterium]|nr:3-dehydro-L-gulonate 2-dehydrogenase [Bacteroidales bacterium]